MNKDEFMQNLQRKAKLLEINLPQNKLEQFYQYMELLIEWNEKINLTAIIKPEEIIEKHFIDSLSINSYIGDAETILDIGTGAGFPGIPLKILQEKRLFTLLDSLNKRINFINIVIQNLELKKVIAVHERAEDFIKKLGEREKYDIVTSRAVAKLNVLLEYMLPFTKIGGKCICMKAAGIEDEIEEAKKAIKVLGGEIECIDSFTLPESDIKRKIIVIKKKNKTPMQYPRRAGIPPKQPII